MLGQLEFFLVKRLDDELAIDQILEGGAAGGLDLFLELLPVVLGPQQSLARSRQSANLRIGNNIAIYDGSDAVDNARLIVSREGTLAKR